MVDFAQRLAVPALNLMQEFKYGLRPVPFSQVVLVDEIDFRFNGNHAALISQVEKFANGIAAVLTVVECALVYIHADETAGEGRVKIARKLHGILKGLLAMIERVLNAVAQRF